MNVQKPKIVTLCGSSRFTDIMTVCAWLIERHEKAITMGLHLLPVWYAKDIPDHLAEAEGVADDMDNLHMRKIDISSEIFVVNYNDYIGDSTKNEIKYTQSLGKKIRWYTHDEIGQQVDKIISDFLTSESTDAASLEVECWYCHKKWGKGHKCGICGREGR